MFDYFDFYRIVLETVRKKKVSDAHDLFNELSKDEDVQDYLQTFGNDFMVDATLEVLDNLIDDGLIKAKRFETKDGPLYLIKGLTTFGHSHLVALSEPSTKEIVVNYLKEEGLPMNLSSIVKAIFRLLF